LIELGVESIGREPIFRLKFIISTGYLGIKKSNIMD